MPLERTQTGIAMRCHPTFLIVGILLVVTSVSLPAQNGVWQVQDSLKSYWGPVTYDAIDAPDTLHCMAIGFASNVLVIARQTTDGGKTWRNALEDSLRPNFFQYQDVAYPVPGLCIVVAPEGTVLRSSDGGDHWNTVAVDMTYNNGTVANPFRIAMLDSLHGIIAAHPLLFRTDDGGYSWQRMPSPPIEGYAFNDVICLRPDSYLVLRSRNASQSYVSRTDDGGANWNTYPVDTIANLSFVDSLHGWGAGVGLTGPGSRGEDIVARTTDGGRSWQTQLKEHIVEDWGLRYVDFADLNHGIAVGRSGKVLHTSNGGATWVRGIDLDSAFRVGNLTSVTNPFPGWAWAVGYGHILHYRENSSGVDDPLARRSASMTLAVAPDPVTASSIVSFNLEQTGYTRLNIVDLNGNDVASLFEGPADVGEYHVPLRSYPLRSGTYFLRMRHRDQVSVKRITVVR